MGLLAMGILDGIGRKAALVSADAFIKLKTSVDLALIPKQLRAHADGVLSRRLTYSPERLDIADIALLKLAILYVNAEHQGAHHLQALLADTIGEFRARAGHEISAAVRLEVLGQVGQLVPQSESDTVRPLSVFTDQVNEVAEKDDLDIELEFDQQHEELRDAYQDGQMTDDEYETEYRRLFREEARAIAQLEIRKELGRKGPPPLPT